MERGAWWATVHGVTKTQTQLSNEHFYCHNYHITGPSTHISKGEELENCRNLIIFCISNKVSL